MTNRWSDLQIPKKPLKDRLILPDKKKKKQDRFTGVYEPEQLFWPAPEPEPKNPYPNDTSGAFNHSVICECEPPMLARRCMSKKNQPFYVCSVPNIQDPQLVDPTGRVVGGYITSPLSCCFFKFGDNGAPTRKSYQLMPKGYAAVDVDLYEIQRRVDLINNGGSIVQAQKRKRESEGDDWGTSYKKPRNNDTDIISLTEMFQKLDKKREKEMNELRASVDLLMKIVKEMQAKQPWAPEDREKMEEIFGPLSSESDDSTEEQ